MLRKILSKEEQARKDEKNRKIIVIILAVIMLFSSLAYFASEFFNKTVDSITYRNTKFKQDDSGYWVFSSNGQAYQTMYNPLQTQNITVGATKTLSDYKDKVLYFGITNESSTSQEGINELIRNIGNIINRNNFACLDENCSGNYPVKNCLLDEIIIFQESKTNSSSIKQVQKCIYLEYLPGETEKTVDSFIFRMLGLQ